MPGRMTISDRDVRTMLDIVHAADREDPDQPLPWPVLASLKQLIGADAVQLCQYDTRRWEDVIGCQEL